MTVTISGSSESTIIGASTAILLTSTASNDTITLGTSDFVHGLPAGSNTNDFITAATAGNDTIHAINASINGGGNLIDGVGTTNEITLTGSSGADTVYEGLGGVNDMSSGGGNFIGALKAGTVGHNITVVGNDTVEVADGRHLVANATSVTINGASSDTQVAFDLALGEQLFTSANLASSIASHITTSGANSILTADHLTITFENYHAVAANFTVIA